MFDPHHKRGGFAFLFQAAGEDLDFYLWEFLADDDRESRAAFLGGLELLGDLRLGEREICGNAGAAQVGDELERVVAPRCVGHDHINLATCGVALEPNLHLHHGMSGFLDEVADHVIAHRETRGGHVHRTIGNRFHQRVVSPPARDGAHRFFRIEHLEDYACVISEAADDGEIQFHESAETAGGEIRADRVVGFRGVRGVRDKGFHLLQGHPEGCELCGENFRLLAFQLVHEAEEIRHPRVIDALAFCEFQPCIAVGDAHHEITCHETEGEHRLDRQRDQLRIGARACLA